MLYEVITDLNQAGYRTQEADLVRVEDRDERDFREIDAFAQQVDADQDIEHALAQLGA